MKLEQKLTINKLIANDIVNYALDDAVCENYNVSLESYLNSFDEESKKYINENIDTILKDIENHESVLDLEVRKDEKGTEIDMIFYIDKLYSNEVEKRIGDTAEMMEIKIELPEIQDMAVKILDDDEFNDDLISCLKNFDNGKDLG
ncbi:MAG: hypothetical protein SPF04_02935 [Bacilli bacterium]|nr:hypothetical protein [Bacilli bacterium]